MNPSGPPDLPTLPHSAQEDNHPDFSHVYTSAMSCLRKLSALRHVSRDKLVLFSMDLCIVACGIRLGYLFDAFAIRDRRKEPKDVLDNCLTELQKEIPLFRSVSLVHESASDQIFFINVRWLQKFCKSGEGDSFVSATTFVAVQGSTAQVASPPPGLATLLTNLAHWSGREQLQGTCPLSADKNIDIGTLIAFAACILQFPVAYVPVPQGEDAFLAGVPLDVYECVLQVDASLGSDANPPEKHVMSKFSCPQAISGEKAELRPKEIVRKLGACFEGRLKEARFPGSMRVRHSVETLDRVAL
ncbi:hypothetical protein BC628DRAFT_682828 [Trametes gibbosa]|nr:hypothetical protein BC628DRAFT_682828 [Trametes gibbosa]